jgi:hypothetical protein
MATYNEDGTNTYYPGESNDRAVAGDPPPGTVAEGATHPVDHPGVEHPGAPAHPVAPVRPTAPIVPTAAPKAKG